jgi:hypothetical protein
MNSKDVADTRTGVAAGFIWAAISGGNDTQLLKSMSHEKETMLERYMVARLGAWSLASNIQQFPKVRLYTALNDILSDASKDYLLKTKPEKIWKDLGRLEKYQ